MSNEKQKKVRYNECKFQKQRKSKEQLNVAGIIDIIGGTKDDGNQREQGV